MKVVISERVKSIMSYTLASFLFVFSQTSMASVQNMTEGKNSTIENLVVEVIQNTEKSLPLVDRDASAALEYVDDAIASIKRIKEKSSPDTHAEAKSPLILDESKEYWFIYPQVNTEIFNNKTDFPTLYSNKNLGLLYRGTNNNDNYEVSRAYFDYAFAYASLLTAKDAIKANKLREAEMALMWVFDAIYVDPDFFIANYDHKLKIDNLININGDYPAYSNLEHVNQGKRL